MIKKCSYIILALLLVFSVLFSSFSVFAEGEENDGQVSETGEQNGEGENQEGEGEGEDTEEANANAPIKDNNGASESLEGYELVSSDTDAKDTLDLYFNKEEIAFKVAQKDANGNILKVWSSQLSPKDLKLNLQEIDPEPDKDDPEREKKNEIREEQIAERKAQIAKINPFDRQSMSLFNITYVNLGDTVNNDKLYTKSSFQLDKEIVEGSYKKTGTGISLQIYFPEINITIPLVIEVDGQELNITIPKDGIIENIEEAEEIRISTESIDKLLKEADDIILSVKKSISDNQERNQCDATLSSLRNKLSIVSQSILSNTAKTVETRDLVKENEKLYESFKRRGIYDKYGSKVEDSIKRMVEVVSESMEHFQVVKNKIADGIYCIQVAPFLGSGTIKEEGYVFYPDGAGAASMFNIPHSDSLGYFSRDIYREQTLNEYSVFNEGGFALYPVFGVNKGKYGFVAIIDKGDYDAAIEYHPGNENYTLGRVYSILNFRRKVRYFKENKAVDIYDLNRIDYDRSLKYIFLKDENADYSGMATSYRDYLKKNGMLNKAIKENEKMPIEVDFFMGAKEETVLGESTVIMTTYGKVKEVLENLKKDGVQGTIHSYLLNWTKVSGYPNKLDADNRLGGEKALKELCEYASNNNIVIGLSINPVYAQKKYSSAEEVSKYYTKDNIGMPIQYESPNGSYTRAFFSPKYIGDQYFDRLISKIKSYGANGVVIESIGASIYTDYVSKTEVLSKGDTAEIFASLAERANKELGHSTIDNGNMYMWKNADRIYGLPLSDDEYFYSDASVPFLQIVLHGNIGYTGYYPYNVMYDEKKQMLEYIEYGCPPGFVLTQQNIADMQFTDESWMYDWLFSSEIDVWYDTILKVYNEFENNIGYLWDKEITHHSQIKEGIKRIEYSDGSIIYVNYNKEDVEFTDPFNNNTINVNSQSYYVAKKGG